MRWPRIVAVATIIFSAVLALVALLDRASIDRFPTATRPFLLAAAIAYTVTGALCWKLGCGSEPRELLARYRTTMLVVLVAYAVSFLPLGFAVLPLGAAAVLGGEDDAARSLLRVLRAFVAISLALAIAALTVALRAEEVFRQRLEGLVQLTSAGLGSWHAVAAVVVATQLPALSAYAETPSSTSWQRFMATYRRGWAIAAIGLVLMVLLFLLTLALIHLERSSGPPR